MVETTTAAQNSAVWMRRESSSNSTQIAAIRRGIRVCRESSSAAPLAASIRLAPAMRSSQWPGCAARVVRICSASASSWPVTSGARVTAKPARLPSGLISAPERKASSRAACSSSGRLCSSSRSMIGRLSMPKSLIRTSGAVASESTAATPGSSARLTCTCTTASSKPASISACVGRVTSQRGSRLNSALR